MIGLTPRQRDALTFLKACAPEMPSYDELALALNLKAKSAAWHVVRRLEERGYVRRPHYRTRAVQVFDNPIFIHGQPYRFIPKSKAA